MYGKGQVESQAYVEGKNPLDVCPYFDGYGYVSQDGGHYKNLWAQGGVRSRIFSKNEPKNLLLSIKHHWLNGTGTIVIYRLCIC